MSRIHEVLTAHPKALVIAWAVVTVLSVLLSLLGPPR